MDFQFDFRLEDATPAQADALLETIILWADRRNCWIAGGYHRIEVPDEEVKYEEDHNPSSDHRAGPGPDPGPAGIAR